MSCQGLEHCSEDERSYNKGTINQIDMRKLHPRKVTNVPLKGGHFKRKGSSSNLYFSGDMLVFGGVIEESNSFSKIIRNDIMNTEYS